MYVLDYDRQLSLIREMTQLRKDSEKWIVYYHHPSTNEMWKSYFPRATEQKKGPKILRTEPVPGNLQERLFRCLTSDAHEDAIGLGIELSVEPQKWETIISTVEDNRREYDRKQLERFLKYLGVETPDDLFAEIGHSPSDYGLDKEDLSDLAWRSKLVRLKRFFFI